MASRVPGGILTMVAAVEIPITSAFQFLQIAHNLKKERQHPSLIEFYRGHSTKDWRLLPSIHRRTMLDFEECLIDEFMRKRPDEFPESLGLFNIIAKMQHYGLQTRLLDITENPTVALYFACSENADTDGEVFMFPTYLDDIPSNTVLNIMAEYYVRYRSSGGYKVRDYYESICRVHKPKDVEMAFYFIANGFHAIARPRIVGERMPRQSGAFMFFANEVCPKENCKNEKCIHRNTDECKKDDIPKGMSERLNTLKVRGILPDITDLHVTYEQDSMRYIVKAKHKKSILSELETIGISRAFLFPELSVEGSGIMDDYLSRVK